MEKRVLAKLRHPLVVTLYQTFQDYSALYFLMELCDGAEMWTLICSGSKLVGCHESLARFYMAELVDVLSYLHSVEIVHRDLKPENLMVGSDGHLKLIDFGTAKDLGSPDLNGPEFVGTPEFMSPECVKSKTASYPTDMWSLGIVIWQMILGTTPFKAPSPYLGFLKIKRGNLPHHPALEDDAYHLINNLVVVDPEARMKVEDVKVHPYFTKKLNVENVEVIKKGPAQLVPSLRDLCIRAVAELAVESSLDVEAPDPGAGGPTDMLRLAPRDRECVMHYLDRMERLSEPRVLRRFYKTSLEAKTCKVRPATRDFLALTSEYEGMFTEPIDFVHVSGTVQDVPTLKLVIKSINRRRPKFVVVTGKLHDLAKRVVAKISETVSFIIADGKHFFTFFCGGCQGIVICGDLILRPDDDIERHGEMMRFLSEQLEQSRMCQHHTFVFVDIDPRKLPENIVEKIAKSRVDAIFGPRETIDGDASGHDEVVDHKSVYKVKKSENETEDGDDEKKGTKPKNEEDGDSDVDSDGYNMVDDNSSVQVLSRGFASIVNLKEEKEWNISMLGIV